MTSALISLKDVSYRYGKESVPALDSINLDLYPGESIGVVGESGSGKTTLGRILVGQMAPTTGSATIEGQNLSELRGRNETRRHVQLVFQDPYSSLNPRLTAVETVAEVYRHWDRAPRAVATTRAVALLSEVGLSREAMTRRPKRLSGGQCQRVGIARALACSPRVLIADEPTSALDVSVQAQILNLLLDLRETHHLALVLVSHDLSVVRYVTQRALVMHRGRVVEEGNTVQLLESPQHEYTARLVDSIPGGSARP
jgi:ABC-type glutathione transport system ATPase component